jgi:prophage antirepressor-like protein
MRTTPKAPACGLLPFGEHSVRYILENDSTPWLVARDVLSLLRLDITRNPGRFLSKLPATDKAYQEVQSAQGPQRTLVVSVRGALAVAKERKRRVDQQVRGFLQREALPLLPQTQLTQH